MASPREPRRASALGGWLVPGLALASVVTAGLRAAAVVSESWPPPWLWALLLLAVVALGLFWPRSGVFARPLIAGARARPWVALTFDDGPDAEITPRILDLLERHGARGTFFVIGVRAEAQPALVAEMAARGHQVENHTYRHLRQLALLPRRRIEAEISAAQEVIARITGRAPRFLRAPVGIISPPVAAAARTCGVTLCAWTAKARDGLPRTSAETALRRLQRAARPGAILLLHDGRERPAGARPPVAPQVLERLLPWLAEQGLDVVTLDRLLAPG